MMTTFVLCVCLFCVVCVCVQDGWSPIAAACYRGNAEVATLLLSTGADIEAKTNVSASLLLLNPF